MYGSTEVPGRIHSIIQGLVLAAGLFTVPSKVQRCTRTYTSYNVVSDTRRVHANNQCATLFHIFFV
jgi:hypothetical protein